MKKLLVFLSLGALLLAGAGCSAGNQNANTNTNTNTNTNANANVPITNVNANTNVNEPVACTMEAKICPDGSSVGRVGPNCEFAPCLGENQPAKTTISFLVSTGDRLKYCNGADMSSDGFRKTITKTMTKEVLLADSSREELIKQSVIAASEEEGLTTIVSQGNDFLKIEGDTAYLAPIDGWAGVSIFLCAWTPLVEVNLLHFPEIKKVVWVQDQQTWQGLK